MNCKRSVDEDRRRAISKEINSTINEYKQIGEFSKVVPSVIRYNLSVVNKTDTRINMVAPEDNTKPITIHRHYVECPVNGSNKEFNLDDVIFKSDGLRYDELPQEINSLPEKIFPCVFSLDRLFEDLPQTIVVGGGKPVFEMEESFEIKAKPNGLSWLLISFSLFLLLAGLLPLIKQLTLFCSQGTNYFRNNSN